jgi:hypothetical protein
VLKYIAPSPAAKRRVPEDEDATTLQLIFDGKVETTQLEPAKK